MDKALSWQHTLSLYTILSEFIGVLFYLNDKSIFMEIKKRSGNH